METRQFRIVAERLFELELRASKNNGRFKIPAYLRKEGHVYVLSIALGELKRIGYQRLRRLENRGVLIDKIVSDGTLQRAERIFIRNLRGELSAGDYEALKRVCYSAKIVVEEGYE